MLYFVGAGPGDPDLITVKGKKLLEEADTVIYAGSLVNPALLSCCRKGARILDSSRMTLPEIVQAVRDTEPGITVRLQTGDTSLYSAITEQREELDRLGIAYKTVPGVSSFCAAAASLNMEYTVPGRSQSLILTRAAGRTPVPETESIEKLAVHRTAMVLFLSAGMAEEVSRSLTAGGYAPQTPAVIVCRASWPDEKKIVCTVGTLGRAAQENGIRKTALLIVGDFLNGAGEKSRLYDPSFTTGYRTALPSGGKNLHTRGSGAGIHREGFHACAFTDRGYALGEKLGFDSLTRISRSRGTVSLSDWTAGHMGQSSALVFIGAAQIAVRAVAGLLKGKTEDPAVLVIDEDGQFVIPVLSGHAGGANRQAEILSERLRGLGREGIPVITTASDRRHVFAVDTWAVSHGMKIENPEKIKDVTSRLLEGEMVKGGFPPEMELPDQVDTEGVLWESGYAERQQVQVRFRDPEARKPVDFPEGGPLLLIPKAISIGIGCRRYTPEEEIEEAFQNFLKETGIFREAVRDLASIDLKKEEKGLLAFAEKEGLPIVFYTADRLKEAEGKFSDSEFVRKITGTGCVCERAAAVQAEDGQIVSPKRIFGRVTVAAAVRRKL